MAAFKAWLVFLILVVNVVGELQRKRTLAASRGFLAAARLSCKTIKCYKYCMVIGYMTYNHGKLLFCLPQYRKTQLSDELHDVSVEHFLITQQRKHDERLLILIVHTSHMPTKFKFRIFIYCKYGCQN